MPENNRYKGTDSKSSRLDARVIGVVRPEELYTLDEVKKRIELREAGLRAARRAGLRVIYRHGRGFVWGRDLIDYILAGSDAPGRKGVAGA